jgi:hypothetical protein
MMTPENKRSFSRIARIVLISSSLSLFPLTVNAAAIWNLTDKPVQFELETGEGYKPFVIQPNRRYFQPGKARFRYQERIVYIEHHEEYAIWPDGALGPQLRMRQRGGM